MVLVVVVVVMVVVVVQKMLMVSGPFIFDLDPKEEKERHEAAIAASAPGSKTGKK